MKTAIISFHNAYNYGAALQAYALQKAIENMGIDCEYIDYINEHRRQSYDMNYLFKNALAERDFKFAVRALLGTPFMKIRGKRFDRFYKKYVRTTSRSYKNSEEAQELNHCYDKFIVGSDQVWNPENNGADFAYLLDFVEDNSKRVSYSPSFGLSEIPDEYIEKYRENLLKFSFLGVREQAGADIVKRLTNQDAELLLDPVFLINKDEWLKLIPQNSGRKKYVFYYTNHNGEIRDFLSTGYSMKGLEYHILSTKITPFDFINPKKKITVAMNPEEFLGEINSAELVVTSSFHCLAFSLILQKPFAVILTGNTGKDERLVNLLQICGLENRIITPDTTLQDITKPINFEEVNQLLQIKITFSKECLAYALGKSDHHPSDSSIRKLRNFYFCEDDRCTGCGACVECCPVQAISMGNRDLFSYPLRDKERCIECGKCNKVCQIFNEKKTQLNQSFWAAKNSDDIRINSSSGGVFPALAKKIIDKGGFVAAASMKSDFSVSHSIISDYSGVKKMSHTFYVQSDTTGIYSQIEILLKKNKLILFVGTPCQVRGLQMYLGKHYSNLYTVDLVCHGIPSPEVYKSFILFLKKKGNLSEYQFRDKSVGWRGYTESAVINEVKYSQNTWLCSFTNLFSHNLINRKSCSECAFSNFQRCGDITIGDFWSVERTNRLLDDGKGISLVICNTDKGNDLFNMIDFPIKEKISCEDAMQNSLVRPAKSSSKRMRLVRMYREKGYEAIARKYGENNTVGKCKMMLRKALKR